MDIKKLLFVTKFEQMGLDALHSLLDLRQAALEHVVFITVIESEKVAMRRGTGYRKEEAVKLRETANIRFIDWAENLFEQGMEVGVYIAVGNMVAEVIKAARKEESDLIVIGQSTKGLLEQLYSGSDVAELIRRTVRPVLVYRHLSDKAIIADRPFRHPLLAMDWSEASLRAVDCIKELKNVVEAVDVIHVADQAALTGTSAMAVQKTRKKARGRLEEVCERLEAEGIEAHAHVYIGEAAQEIEKAARECKASMVVMGSSAKAYWVERWIGSVTRSVAEKSAFPTLIIPPVQQ